MRGAIAGLLRKVSGGNEDRRIESFEDSTEYKEAVEHIETFEPKEGIDYGWVFDYAYREYERDANLVHALDAKAHTIINYLGAFLGISAITFCYQAAAVHWVLGLSILPSFVFALSAMCRAARVRRPMGMPFPPSAWGAIQYIEYFGARAKTIFIPQLIAASEGMGAIAKEKAAYIRGATDKFVWCVVLLILPVITSVIVVVSNSVSR